MAKLTKNCYIDIPFDLWSSVKLICRYDMPIAKSWAVVCFAHEFQVVFQTRGGWILSPKLPNFPKNQLFYTCFFIWKKKKWRKIDQKFQYYQLNQQKLFNLITNFMEISLSKAKKYWNLKKNVKIATEIETAFCPVYPFIIEMLSNLNE